MSGEFNRAPRWTVISKRNCKWCDQAINELGALGQLVTKIDIAEAPGVLALIKIQGLNTVPQIFRNLEFVGGYNELKRYLNGDNREEADHAVD